MELLRDLRGIRMDGDVFFKAVEDDAGKIVNVAHTESGDSLPRLYEKNQPVVIGDFIKFLEKQKEWYEERFRGNRALEAAFGD